MGLHWSNSFFIKSKKINFIFGKDFFNLNITNSYIKNLKINNNFFFLINFFIKYKNFNFNKKIYYITNYISINFLQKTSYNYSKLFLNLNNKNLKFKIFLYE